MLYSRLSCLISLLRTFSTVVPLNRVKVTTMRSSGPGGQSVNKSETKVQARFNVNEATWMSEELRQNFIHIHKSRITKEGDFVVEASEYANQQQNRKACIDKLNKAIRIAEEYEPEEKLSFLEHIEKTKTKEEVADENVNVNEAQIRQYKEKRRESRRKLKRIGDKRISDF